MEKRVLSFLLVLGLIFSMPLGTALAAGTSGNTATNGNPLNATWYLDESGKVLTLRGTREMGNGHLTGSSTVETVIIEEGITSIGNDAFDGFKLLSHVTLPRSITAIGQSAFAACESLTELILPDEVSSIGPRAFERCEKLTGITIPAKVKEISENTFRECYELERVTIPNGVLSIRNSAFYNCSKLTDITIPDSVTSIGESAFYDCDLLDIEIPSKVNQIGKNAFGFTALQTATIPSGVTLIDEITFQYCRKLSSITIPSSVGRIADFAFSGCDGLKDVYFKGSQTQWEQIEIGRSNDYLTSATIHFLGEEAKTYSLRFYPNGGTGKLPEPAFYKAGEVIMLSVAPSREGYIFAGWSDGQKTYQPGARFTMPEKNVTLTAQWTPYTPPVYPMLSYDLKGGTGTLPGATPYAAGTTVKISDVIPIQHEVFLGWYSTIRPERVYLPGESFIMPNHDVVLNAVWGGRIPILEYNLNGGTGENIPQSESKLHGEMVIITMSTPVREGYRFIGWSDKKEGGTKLYSPGDFFNMPNMDTVLFAQWKVPHSLGFDLDGGTGTVPEPTLYVEGELVTMPAGPVKVGTDFAGWFDEVNKKMYNPGDQFTMPDRDITLKAMWLSAEEAYVQQLTQYSLVHADAVTRETIQNAIYNLLFKAQFRPAKGPAISGTSVTFTGSNAVNARWPAQNKDPYTKVVTDGILGEIPFNESGAGCMAYALFATAYVYGTSGTRTECSDRSANGIKAFFHQYADPGEQIRYMRSNGSMHSTVFLGEPADGNGFYYISYGGGVYPGYPTNHTIEVGYWTYAEFAMEATQSLTIRDTNKGSYYSGELMTNSRTIKRIISRLECPIEATITYGAEVLDSRKPGSVNFGSVTRDDQAIVFDMEYNTDYLLEIFGTGEGKMTLTLDYYYDEECEDLADRRKFIEVPITASSEIYSSGFDQRASFVLYVNENGEEISTWGTGANEIAVAPDADYSSANNIPDNAGSHGNSGNSSSSGSSNNSGGSSSRYSISVPGGVIGGMVRVSSTSASAGTMVTITTTPNNGYKLATLTVTDSKGNELKLTDKGDGKYTFIMPSSKVNVSATFTKIEDTAKRFTDVASNAYYADAVAWAVEKGITVGTSSTTFSPDAPCTRAQIVTFLWRAAGSPSMSGSNPFIDVAPGSYYYDAVQWAVAQGITVGTSATTFSPDAICTRGQTVTFLYRYEKSPAVSGGNAFTDIPSDAYYTNAVQWAVNNSVTSGTSATTFSPNATCTRSQIVTFLYRDMA